MGPLLEALEENVELLKLLGEVGGQDSLQVRIGHENSLESLNSASVVSTGYGSDTASIARMGIIGPTHMNYMGYRLLCAPYGSTKSPWRRQWATANEAARKPVAFSSWCTVALKTR